MANNISFSSSPCIDHKSPLVTDLFLNTEITPTDSMEMVILSQLCFVVVIVVLIWFVVVLVGWLF